MPNISITINGVSKQLSKLNPGKAAGPDKLSSRILKELHREIASMLTDTLHFVRVRYQMTGEMPVSRRCKKAPRPKQRITAPYDMPDMIGSNIRLFADDTIMYLTITNQSDCNALQADLTKLETCESEWLMALNPDKCEVIRITNKKKPTLFKYTLHGISLKETDSAKYLGVTITKDLSCSKHINQITTKANHSLNFIKRNIQTNNPKLKESAYVRPFVEYAASVCDPWQNKYIEKIELIQHRAIRYIFNDYSSSSSVTNMRSKLNLPTLKKRREISPLILFYKIKHHLVNIIFPDNIHPSLRSRYTLTFPRSTINAHKESFFPITAKLWNNLPFDLCNSPDLGSFRGWLLKSL